MGIVRFKCIFIFLFLLFFFPSVKARVGVGIAPSTGTYNFTLEGGSVHLTIYNTGDTTNTYEIILSGTAANFSYVKPQVLEIGPNSLKSATLFVEPDSSVRSGENYTLKITVRIKDRGPVSITAESNLLFHFYENKTAPYPGITREVIYGWLIIVGAAGAILLTLIITIRWKGGRRKK